MSDTNRTEIDSPRGGTTPEWEVFYRETAAQPLWHVGSVSASTEATAREQASALFGDAHSLWLCPAAAVARFTAHSLGGEAAAGGADGAGGERE